MPRNNATQVPLFDDNAFAVGMHVKITCRASKYFGEVGFIHEIQESTRYAMVDLPKGTERRIEGIVTNRILQQRKKKKNKPKGDPQWFPLNWLEVVGRQGIRDV